MEAEKIIAIMLGFDFGLFTLCMLKYLYKN